MISLVFWSNKDELYQKIGVELEKLYTSTDTEFSDLLSILGIDKELKELHEHIEKLGGRKDFFKKKIAELLQVVKS